MSENMEYIKSVSSKIQKWKDEPPSVIGSTLSTILSPISNALTSIIPQSIIEASLNAADWMAETMISDESLNEAKGLSLEEMDANADSVQNWAIGYAAAEGGAAGAIGLLSLPADVPFLITLSLRTIRRVGACYGYDGKGEEEKQFVLSILSAAGANTVQEKAESLAILRTLQNTLIKTTWKKMAENASNTLTKDALLIFIRDIAKQLGINITKRKALAAIPLIGAVVGGSLNAWYLRDIGIAAQRTFQERWIKDHQSTLES